MMMYGQSSPSPVRREPDSSPTQLQGEPRGRVRLRDLYHQDSLMFYNTDRGGTDSTDTTNTMHTTDSRPCYRSKLGGKGVRGW